MHLPKLVKRPAPDYWLSVVIERWEWQYSVSLPTFAQDEVLDEGDALTIFGSTKVTDRPGIRKVRLRCLPKDKITRSDQWRERPQKVGDLYQSKSDLEGAVVIGSEALPSVIAMLATGLYRQLVISALKLDRQRLAITHYEFKQISVGENDG